MKIGDIYSEKLPTAYNAEKIQYMILCIDGEYVFCRKTEYNKEVKKVTIPEVISHCIMEINYMEYHLEKENKIQ